MKVLDFEKMKILHQWRGPKFLDMRKRVKKSRGSPHFNLNIGGILIFQNSKVVPSESKIKEKVFVEALMAPYLIHQSSTKMYQD